MHRRLTLLLGLWVACLIAAPLQARQPNNKAVAKKHFERGELAYQQGDFTKALAAYKRAQATYRHPAFIFNIAQCYRQLRTYDKALFFYRLFLAEQPEAPNKAEVKRRILKMEKKVAEMQRLRSRVGRLSIITSPEGASVRVDKFTGPPAGTTPTIIKLSEGEHLVLIKKPGFKTVHQTVAVKSGRIAILKLTLDAVARPGPARPDLRPQPDVRRPPPVRVDPGPGDERRRVAADPVTPPPGGQTPYKPYWKRWWFGTGVGVGGLALILGAVAGTSALAQRRDYLDTGNKGALQDAKKAALAADILLGTGVALAVAVTVAAVIVHKRWKKRERPTAVIAPACGTAGCGLWVVGSF